MARITLKQLCDMFDIESKSVGYQAMVYRVRKHGIKEAFRGLHVPARFLNAVSMNGDKYHELTSKGSGFAWCAMCNGMFLKGEARQKYCSRACGTEAALLAQGKTVSRRGFMSTEFVCVVCGVTFTPRTSGSSGKCCSYDCGVVLRKESCTVCGASSKGECKCSKPAAKLVDCIACGVVFPTHKKHVVYCSSECSKGISRGPAKCTTCGDMLTHNGRTCDSCQERKRKEGRARIRRNRGLSHIQRAKKYNVPYERGITWRSIAERDGLECMWCGVICNPELHHNDDLYPSLEHIVPLHKGVKGHVGDNCGISCRGCNHGRQIEDAKGSVTPGTH